MQFMLKILGLTNIFLLLLMLMQYKKYNSTEVGSNNSIAQNICIARKLAAMIGNVRLSTDFKPIHLDDER